jgi:hypothetical protein
MDQEMAGRVHSDIWSVTDIVPVLKSVTRKRIGKYREETAIVEIYYLATSNESIC